MDKESLKKVEQLKNLLEYLMFSLPKDNSINEHQNYLAGYIDCLFETGQITDSERGELYVQYVGWLV